MEIVQFWSIFLHLLMVKSFSFSVKGNAPTPLRPLTNENIDLNVISSFFIPSMCKPKGQPTDRIKCFPSHLYLSDSIN